MKSFTPEVIPQVESFNDPYELGATFLIGRLGSSKSGSREVEAFITKVNQGKNKAKREAMKRAKLLAPKASGLVDIYSLMGEDQVYGEELRDIDEEENRKEDYHSELNAISVVRGWSGKAFTEKELPIDGAFDNDRIREMIFEPHGPLEDEEDKQVIVQRFKNIETGEMISNQSDIFDTIETMFDKVSKECVKKGEAEEKKLQDEFNRLEFDGKQKFEYEAMALQYRDKIRESYKNLREEYDKKAYTKLEKMGYAELPFFSYTLRVALALWIVEKAVEVEANYNRKKGTFRRA